MCGCRRQEDEEPGEGHRFGRCSAESLWPRKNCLGASKDLKEATVARGEGPWAERMRAGEVVEAPDAEAVVSRWSDQKY